MLPIFNNFIKFLKDKQCPIELEEGYFWWDNCIIKTIYKGNIINVARMWINEDLSIKKWSLYNDEYQKETWEESYEFYKMIIAEKEREFR